MPDEIFTVESPAGIYLTAGTPRYAHIFCHEFLADLFVKDTHDATVFVTPVRDLKRWLEFSLASGVFQALEHTVADVHARSITDWLNRLNVN